jgi:hypothetical protein
MQEKSGNRGTTIVGLELNSLENTKHHVLPSSHEKKGNPILVRCDITLEDLKKPYLPLPV